MSGTYRVVVIGGGASGMAAAIAAARLGAAVTVVESHERVGRKLLATGNGRCNLTNVNMSRERFVCGQAAWLEQALGQYSVQQVQEFFAGLGVVSRVEEEGRVYPATGQAASVLDALRYELERLGVEVVCDAPVTALERRAGGWSLAAGSAKLEAQRVIVCAGGLAAPHLGGTAAGLQLLSNQGHTVLPQSPVLAPLTTEPAFGPRVKGVKAACLARLEIDGWQALEVRGEVQFAEYGLTGIPALQFSLRAAPALREQKPVVVILDLVPELDHEQLQAHLCACLKRAPDAAAEVSLAGTVHKRLFPILLKACDIDPSAPAREQDLPRLVSLVKQWRLAVSGVLGWREAQVMVGGVSVEQFDPLTLESRLAPGLFAAGEVLDVAGECGGYNLHWAWVSGMAAGKGAASAG
jgi:predicted Rossmann fold flavoprotein